MDNQPQDDSSSTDQNQLHHDTVVEDLPLESTTVPQPTNTQHSALDDNHILSTNSNTSPSTAQSQSDSSTTNSTNDQVGEQLQVYIKNPIYREETSPFTLTVPSNTTIGQLKQRLSTEYPGKPSPDRQRLIYGGRILSDAIPLSTAISPSARELYSRHTLHLVVRNDEHTNPTPRTPPQPITNNGRPPDAPRPTRITRLPPSGTHNPPSSNLTYAQRLSLMHSLLARMIQLDRNAESTHGVVPGSRQHDDQRMLIRQTVTESVNLVRQIEQHAQMLRFLLYVPDFYNQFQATTYPLNGREILQLPHWMEPITNPWQQPPPGFQPHHHYGHQHDQFPFDAALLQQQPPNLPPPVRPNNFAGLMNFNNALARFRQLEENEPQQNQNPPDSHFLQHAHHMHHHQHPGGPGPNPMQQQQPQQPQQPAPQPNPDAVPPPQQQPAGEMQMNADDFRRLMMDNIAAMMQQNAPGNAPGEPAPPAPAPDVANGNPNPNINANQNDPNAPVVRQFVFQFEIDWSLIVKLLFLVYLFAQGGNPRRVYSLAAVAITVYLWHRGYLTFLGRLLRAALPSPRNVVDSLFPVRQEGTDDQPVIREQSRFGRLSLVFTFVYAFVYGFLCSLLPGWNPEPIPRANEIIPPGPNQVQQQQDNQEGNQADAPLHAHVD